MTLAEQIYQHSRSLPEQAAREALDFIEHLERRYSAKAAASSRLGFMAGEFTVPDDFDQMGCTEIESMFTGSKC